MSENKRIYLNPPHMCGLELKYIQDAFNSNWIAPVGPYIDIFEKDICTYTGAYNALAVSSGTAALHLALILEEINENDEVLCSTFTFAGSVFPILYQHAIPVFIDSDFSSWNMDPQALEDAVKDRIKKGKKPKAVIVVHLYGQSADLDPIVSICSRYNITMIEDAAEAVGTFYKNKHTGTFGEYGFFSFNGNKILTTSGGGMLVSPSKKKIEKARFIATQARDPAPYYEHTTIGYNYRMSNILAAIGCGQLKVLKERIQKKRDIFSYYKKKLGSIKGLSFMPEPSYGFSTRWLTCIYIDPAKAKTNSENIRNTLEKENIESRLLWKPMHLQPVFKQYSFYGGQVSQSLFNNGLCLPSGTALTDDQLDRITYIIQNCF